MSEAPSPADAGNPAKAVREEDAFDVAAAQAWLAEHGAPAFRELFGGDLPEVRQFPGGASNLTYLLRYPTRDLILRQDLPWELPVEEASRLCRNTWDVLIELHSVDVDAVPALASLHKGDGYVARQVAGWTDRLARAATDDMGDWSPITAWLDAVQPPDVAARLIHNDFRLDNVVLAADDSGRLVDGGRVVGVLDWEMATVGDPLMDLGGSMAYWIQDDDDEFMQGFRRQPSNAPGMWTRAEIVDHYCAAMGFTVAPERWRFYEVFGYFRLAVIAQQIWYRYFHGQTTNPAYAVFGPAVAVLEARCRALIG